MPGGKSARQKDMERGPEFRRNEIMNATNEQLDKIAAIKVMGWKKEYVNRVVECWMDDNGEKQNTVSDWNPTTDMNDAMMLLCQPYFFLWDIKRASDIAYTVIIKNRPDPMQDTVVHNSNLSKSITIAAILAKESD